MTGWIDPERAAGPADDADLRATDELLDRLGRRAPDTADLDDVLAASLAVLAGDVDLGAVSVAHTQRALIAAGAWPSSGPMGELTGELPQSPDGESTLRGGVAPEPQADPAWGGLQDPFAPPPGPGVPPESSPASSPESSPWSGPGPVDGLDLRRPAASHRADVATIVGPRRPPESPRSVGGGRGRRAADRRSGDRRRADRRNAAPSDGARPLLGSASTSGDVTPLRPRTRVFHMRASVGLVGAAALVVLGGTMALLMVGDETINPLSGLTTVVQRWADPNGDQATRAELLAKVEAARSLLQEGKPADAARLIDVVRDQIDDLDADDKRAVETKVDEVAGQLLEQTGSASDGSTASGTGLSGDATPGAMGSAASTLDERDAHDRQDLTGATGGAVGGAVGSAVGSTVGATAGSAAGSVAGASSGSSGSTGSGGTAGPTSAGESANDHDTEPRQGGGPQTATSTSEPVVVVTQPTVEPTVATDPPAEAPASSASSSSEETTPASTSASAATTSEAPALLPPEPAATTTADAAPPPANSAQGTASPDSAGPPAGDPPAAAAAAEAPAQQAPAPPPDSAAAGPAAGSTAGSTAGAAAGSGVGAEAGADVASPAPS
jgi:hypothetical protein